MSRAMICVAIFVLLLAGMPAFGFTCCQENQNFVEIKVAVYDSVLKNISREAKDAIEYSWEENGIKYEIVPSMINRSDIVRRHVLTEGNFDVILIPGSGRPYFDAYDVRWREEVKKFVEDGGGYVGICGGANLASMGFNEGLSINSMLSISTLGIANVYVNDQQGEEWQYLWKSNWKYGLPPVNVYIPDSGNPVMEGFYGTYRSIRYGGGPGMYPAGVENNKCGEIVPLAIYAEEPMEAAPIHRWKWSNGWKIAANITTDIKGEYAAIATTYGNGRIVLFGPHPEKKTFFGGHIEEFPVRKNTRFTWFIYNWSDGIPSDENYNWWMLQRSVAWTAHCPVPHKNEGYMKSAEPILFMRFFKLGTGYR